MRKQKQNNRNMPEEVLVLGRIQKTMMERMKAGEPTRLLLLSRELYDRLRLEMLVFLDKVPTLELAKRIANFEPTHIYGMAILPQTTDSELFTFQ